MSLASQILRYIEKLKTSSTDKTKVLKPDGVGGVEFGDLEPLSLIDFEPQLSPPAHLEGRIFYDNVRKTFSGYNAVSDVTVNFAEENLIPVCNQTGVTITNGQAVRVDGALGGCPLIVLSQADSVANASVTGVATHDIEHNTTGYITTLGSVGGLNTSSFNEGNVLVVDSTTPGLLVNVEQKINNPVAVVLFSDPNNGTIEVNPRGVVNVTSIAQTRGVAQTQDIDDTPVKAYCFNLNEFEKNVTVDQVLNPGIGSGYSAVMTPTNISSSGFYRFFFNISITSTANRLHVFELYINGVSTGVVADLDLRNNNVDSGNGSITGVTESVFSNGDTIEVYVYFSGSGSGTVTYNSSLFGIERIGNV